MKCDKDCQMTVGKEVEKEHTDDEREARQIASDHIEEKPDYYTRLVSADLVDEPEALDKYEKYCEEWYREWDKLCEEGKLTKRHLNNILESMPETIRDRVRRHTNAPDDLTARHRDEEGHDPVPEFPMRVEPKRQASGNKQMTGAGRVGHRHSARTQARVPQRFVEALSFIQSHIGEDINKCDLTSIKNRPALIQLSQHMMSTPGINRDWLNSLLNALRTRHE